MFPLAAFLFCQGWFGTGSRSLSQSVLGTDVDEGIHPVAAHRTFGPACHRISGRLRWSPSMARRPLPGSKTRPSSSPDTHWSSYGRTWRRSCPIRTTGRTKAWARRDGGDSGGDFYIHRGTTTQARLYLAHTQLLSPIPYSRCIFALPPSNGRALPPSSVQQALAAPSVPRNRRLGPWHSLTQGGSR